MVNHTVLFKLKAEASEAQIQEMIDRLHALEETIPSLDKIHVNYNFSDRSQGHQVMLYSLFADKAALQAYAVHPAHVAVLEENIKPILEGVTVGDIEF
ncbi:Dabb family protein [Algivirga pacifica]|uniref:Stress-response A/B barrel domain-containing protein n=1 Tax=Algivirga pacifica TaxID=1162670 RepID=A0ABP9DH91_9BACT